MAANDKRNPPETTKNIDKTKWSVSEPGALEDIDGDLDEIEAIVAMQEKRKTGREPLLNEDVLRKMKLHESIAGTHHGNDLHILKVMNGWIYTVFRIGSDNKVQSSSVFVPFF